MQLRTRRLRRYLLTERNWRVASYDQVTLNTRALTTGPCLVLSFALLAAGCDSERVGPSPIVPTIAKTVLPPTLPAPRTISLSDYDQTWQLTTRVTRVSNWRCSPSPAPGGQATGAMAAARSGSDVRFLYFVANYPTDDVDYAGTTEHDDFAAQSVLFVTTVCGEQATFQGTLVGRFSNDGQHLDAQETWSYHLSSGDAGLSLSWTADRLPQ